MNIQEIKRCSWCEKDDLYRNYHDNEWGIPIFEDKKIFEYLLLETFQAGLSWHTILKKREGFKIAFDDFDYLKIANYNDEKKVKLLNNPEIIRNKLKINASVENAKAFIKIQEEFGSFSSYIWKFVNNIPIDNKPKTLEDIPSKTILSDAISMSLKKRGFKFVGSTVVYAHMQATGMVNDHVIDCYKRKKT